MRVSENASGMRAGRVLQEANSKKPELTCSRCGGHMGHVFKSSRYPGPKHQRHCVNSVSVRYVEGKSPELAEAKVV